MKKPYFEPVKDNEEKRKTYSEVKIQLKKALSAGFYGEAIMIDYAMMEDRLKSFLYHIGALKTKDSFEIDNYAFIEKFNLSYKENKDGSKYVPIKDISKKIKIVRKVLKTIQNYSEKDQYLFLLFQTLGEESIKRFLDNLKKIEKWKDPRNEIVHALFNKNIEAVKEEYEKLCENGLGYAESINTQVKKVKRTNSIRKAIGL